MNSQDKDYFKKVLIEKRKEVEEIIKLHGSNDPIEVGDLIDKSHKLQNVELDEIISSSEDNLIKKIDYALQRIERDEYFSCEQCGDMIAIERLKANPSSSTCIECQKKIELNSK